MAGAICIITPSGMKCLSSPLKDHHPGDVACEPTASSVTRDEKVAKLREKLADKDLEMPATRQGMIAQIVELMLAANVGADTPFTIVRAG